MTRRSRFWPRFAGWALSVPVRVKIMGIVLGVIFLLSIVVTYHVRATMRATMREDLQARGISIARDVAGRATDLILTDNLFAVHELVRERVETDHDIRYILIVDRSQAPVAHTFGGSFPPDLLPANSVGAGEEFALAVLDTEEGLVWDVAVPVLEGKLGTVRVGMSERHLGAVLVDTTRFLLLVTACASFVGVVTAYLLTFVLTKPIHDLVEAAEAIEGGNLQRKVPVRSRDEIGRLSAAFNAMTEALARSQDEIEQYNRQLSRRNEELSVLNAVAQTVTRSLNLGDVLDGALEKVFEVVKVRAGWVFLQNGEEQHLLLAASKGLPNGSVLEGGGKKLGSCICREVMDSRKARISDALPACSRLSREVLEREGLRCHVSIPLETKDRVLGIMNLVCDGDQGFGEHDLELLTSIGHQIGMAIDNACLYEEVQHKETSRRRLLDKLIEAQEEERRRVARELHDQAGQSLTALIMSLGNIEDMLPSGADEVRSQLAEISSFTTAILEEVRRLMMDLRPILLDDLGLIPAIRSYAETHLARARVQAHIAVAGVKRKLPSSMEIALFRVVQEAIMNTVKHAEARKATIHMRFNESSIAVTIEDDGKGFDHTGPGVDISALGLLGMQERVELLGGNLRIDSQLGRGTRISLEIPTSPEPG